MNVLSTVIQLRKNIEKMCCCEEILLKILIKTMNPSDLRCLVQSGSSWRKPTLSNNSAREVDNDESIRRN